MKGVMRRDFRDLEDTMGLGAVIEGSIFVLVPLYMFSLGIPLEEAGVIVALSPFVFGVVRLLSAILSDIEGVKPFLVLQSISYMLLPLVFFFMPNIVGFSIGMILQGIARGSIWAVARTAAFKFRRREDSSSKIVGVRYVGLGIGRFFSLSLSSMIGYSYTFLLLFLVGIKSFLSSLDIIEKGKKLSVKAIKKEVKHIVKKRERNFYLSSLFIGLSFSSITLMLNLLLLYVLRELYSFSLIEIAFVITIAYLFSSFILFKLNSKIDKRVVIVVSTLSLILGVFLISIGGLVVYIGASLLGIAGGIILKNNELIIFKFMEKEDRSLSIALLTFPISIIQALFYSTSGFFVDVFGIYNYMYAISLLALLSLVEIGRIYEERSKEESK